MKDNSKRENVKNFRVKLTGVLGITAGICVLFLLFTIITCSIISVHNVRTSSMETAVNMGKNKLIGDMKNFEDKIVSEYGQLSLQNGKLVGQQGVSPEYHYEIVDEFCSGVGIVATVFVREDKNYRRITTSIVNDKGERAINTFLGTNSAAYPSIQSGNEYVGNATILGRDYLTHYKPIIESNNGDIIGIYFIGIEMVKMQEIISKNTSTHVTQIIIVAIAIMLLLLFANVLIFNTILVKPIQTVTAIIGKLSVGDIDQQIDESKSRNEIGTMQNELRCLIDGLKHTASFAQNIGEGLLNAEYQPLSDADLLGNSLLEMRKSLQNAEKAQAIRVKEEEQRNWGTAGLAKFAEILRQDNNNLEALSYNVISNMVKYLGINQGGIFVLNDVENKEDRVLEMKACYAFERKKFVDKKIHPGEGLVGTCFLEGEPIYMTEVPNEYITITSGLGGANPRAILISPLKMNDKIFGVIELASFHPFEPYQLDFVQKVSESIAAIISTVNINIRTDRLLAQTKLQAEEMANHKEELRQNMEEMQATQEEMRRRESDLQETVAKMQETQAAAEEKKHEMDQFHNAIFSTSNVTEFSSDLIITDLNQNMADLFGQNRSDFIGKHMSSFLSEETFNAVKTNVMNGKIHEDVQKMKLGDGKSKTIIQKFVPINDKEGNLQRVLLIAFHDKS